LDHFRLSSKNHLDVPLLINGKRVHLLASHPTPPGFDGPEDRNGLRNEAEIQFWVDYINPERNYHYDDRGKTGGLPGDALFVVAGDLNADPIDGSDSPAINRLLRSSRVSQAEAPASRGGEEQAKKQAGANQSHKGPDKHDTLDAPDREDKGDPGNLRVDYVVPSKGFRVIESGIFWPSSDDPLSELTGEHPFPSSDHRLVWVDVEFE
ncbi:MAG: endonuclease/exonuclease/phosphatase family protein, partial [Lacipirellulaceae bacterium]